MAGLAGKRWGDVDDDDDDDVEKTNNWETKTDANGVFTRFNYEKRENGTYKVVQRCKATILKTWTNEKIQERKDLPKFGKAAQNDPAAEKALIVKSEDDVPFEFSRKIAAQVHIKDEAEDKFYEESLVIAENLNVKKLAWTELNKAKQEDRDVAGAEPAAEPEKAAALGGPAGPGEAAKPTGYVPPSIRNGATDAKGKGKGGEEQASLRITQISDDCKEGDLQDLFGSVGRVSRVYIARDMETKESRGFAFVTYYTKADAEKAIKKLDGHPYDNLILRVQFAKPRV